MERTGGGQEPGFGGCLNGRQGPEQRPNGFRPAGRRAPAPALNSGQWSPGVTRTKNLEVVKLQNTFWAWVPPFKKSSGRRKESTRGVEGVRKCTGEKLVGLPSCRQLPDTRNSIGNGGGGRPSLLDGRERLRKFSWRRLGFPSRTESLPSAGIQTPGFCGGPDSGAGLPREAKKASLGLGMLERGPKGGQGGWSDWAHPCSPVEILNIPSLSGSLCLALYLPISL